MEFRVLGVLEALEAGLPLSLGGPKQRSVLAMLLLEVNRSVSTDRLIEGLWGADPPQRAASTLQVYVSNLRKVLEPDRGPRAEPSVLLTQSPGYRLVVVPEQVDLFRFERMVRVARDLAADGCFAGAAVLFGEALALWRETPLADLANEPFATIDVPTLEEARIGATEDHIDAELALGRDVGVPELEVLVARYPYRERLRRQLMVALYRSGRQADALSAYQSARRVLVEELGIEPSRELREAETAILVHDRELDSDEPASLTADEVSRVLQAANGVVPDPSVVESIVARARDAPRRAEEELRQAIEREQAGRLSSTLATAGATQVELVRARRVAADKVLDRRRRREPVAAVGACPYKGLLRFEPEDVGWYFGRERVVADLLATVASARCVGVVGASGSGKSSLARAGLLAALADDALPGSAQWPRVLVNPGADPTLELARVLAPLSHAVSADHVRDRLLEDPSSLAGFAERAMNGAHGDGALMIVVDQLEEVFAVCRDEEVRARFLDVLVCAAADPDSPSRVLVAIRSDYYGRCAEHAAFAELLGRANLLVGPMRPDELQRAIEEPARRAGLVLEDGLVERIFDDVGSEPGSLPLLETALLETWSRRSGNTLTLEGYASAGGVHGAVAHLADDVYARLSSSEQAAARGIFLRLAEPGVGTNDVRRRAPLDELVADDEQAAVLTALVDHRLVVTNDATAEVAHEALLREWPRLRGWLEEDREGRRVQRALAIGAQEWTASDHDEDLLLRGSRLAAAVDVAHEHPTETNPVEREFLIASRAQQDSDLHSARRTARRFRRLTVGLAALLVVAVVAGAFSLVERSRADDNASRAKVEAATSAATSLATQARSLIDDNNPDLALLLAVEARRVHSSVDTDGALESSVVTGLSGVEEAVTVEPRVVPKRGDPRPFSSIAEPYPNLSPNGGLVAAAGTDGFVRLFDTTTGRVVRRFGGSGIHGPIGPVFNRDGSRLAVGSDDGRIRVFNVATGRSIGRPLVTPSDGPAYALFDPADDREIFTAAHDGTISRWDVDARSPRRVDLFRALAATQSFPLIFQLSFDGKRLIVGDPARNGPTTAWDVDSRTQLSRVSGTPSSFDADGETFVTNDGSGLAVWNLQTGALVSATGDENGVSAGNLTPRSADGRFAAVQDPKCCRIHVIDVATGAEVIPPITAHTSRAIARFLPDGRLFTASAERVVIVRPDHPVAPIGRVLAGSRTTGARAGFTASSGRVVTFNLVDGTRVWNADGGALLDRLASPGDASSAVFPSPNLHTALLVDKDGTLRVTDIRRGRLGAVLPTSQDALAAIAWSPDSKTLAVAFDESTILWRVDDAGHARRVARLHSFGGPDTDPWRTSVVFSPDSTRVVVVQEHSGVATMFDAGTGVRLGAFQLPAAEGQTMSAATFSPDGKMLVAAVGDTAQGSGRVAFFDAATRVVRRELTLTYAPRGIAYVEDGRRFVTLHADRASTDTGDGAASLDIWDTSTLRAVGVPLEFPAGAASVSSSGNRAVLATDAGFAVVWDFDPQHWTSVACNIAGRSLTRAEWHQYLPGRPYDPACNARSI